MCKEQCFEPAVQLGFLRKNWNTDTLSDSEAALQCDWRGLQTAFQPQFASLYPLAREVFAKLAGPVIGKSFYATANAAAVKAFRRCQRMFSSLAQPLRPPHLSSPTFPPSPHILQAHLWSLEGRLFFHSPLTSRLFLGISRIFLSFICLANLAFL